MKITNKTVAQKLSLAISSSLLMLIAMNTSAEEVNYANAMKSQLTLPELVLASVNNNRETVHYSRVLDSKALALEMTKQSLPFVESQQYIMRVSGAQLNKGFAIDTTGEESLVRITPTKDNSKQSLKVDELLIITPDGQKLSAQNAMSFKANSRDLQSTPFPQGTSVFKFDKGLGKGKFTMKSSSLLKNDQEYIVSVLEKSSPYQLKLQTNSRRVFAGQNFTATVQLDRFGFTSQLDLTNKLAGRKEIIAQSVKLSKVKGHFLSPDGRIFPAKFSAVANGKFEVKSKIDLPLTATQGLWELQVSTGAKDVGLNIKRDARIAFAYSPVTALVEQVMKPQYKGKGSLKSMVSVNVEYAGRYEVMAELYSIQYGHMNPVMESRTAMWLEVGSHQVPLLFDLKSKGLQRKSFGSYKIRNITLTDQTRMSIFPQKNSLTKSPVIHPISDMVKVGNRRF